MARTTPTESIAAATLRWFHGHAAQGIVTTNSALSIQGWNHWLAVATGLAEAEVIGRPLFEVCPSLVERGFDQHYHDALSGQVKILSHTLHRHILPAFRPGTAEQMPQGARIAPLMEGDRVVGTITVIEDVTDRVATERELRLRIAAAELAREQAEDVSRVKDEFLATLSHEIRTPLSAVLGWIHILKSREPDAITVKRAIEVIDRNARAQLTLITDMLDMARITSGKVRLDLGEVDLAAVTMSAIDVVRPAADAKSVRIATNLPHDLPAIRGDADRLLQVVWNLMSNAVKFTPAGGTATVSIRAEGGTVSLSVVDTGEGISSAFLPQVFERFKQADPSAARRHGGLGLGLALVKELVELHGGIVSVHSEGVGRGSTFQVHLPAPSREVEAPALVPQVHPVTAPTLKGVRVLVVEDDADAGDIAATVIADAGGQVMLARSAAEALTIVKDAADAERPHVIITDIGLPVTDGYALLRLLRNLPEDRGGALPIAAVTAYASAEDRSQALQRGFDAHLSKPFAPTALVSTIARLSAGLSE